MLQLTNDTGLEGLLFASADPAGVDSLYTILKGTFELGDTVVLAEEQLPVTLAAEHYGDPAESSISVPSDVSLCKPGTDVMLVGHAYAPDNRPVTSVDVALAVGPLQKIVRVYGDRYWVSNSTGHAMSLPEPFERMPLVWERAYGGTMQVGGAVSAEPRNPVGTGYWEPQSETPLDGVRLPNLEDPYEPITSWKERPAPACFAPVAAHWMPRRLYAGTYDESWNDTRAPYLPEDFDARFFQLAPAGLVSPGHLGGGEPVQVHGASPEGPLMFHLPSWQIEVHCDVDGRVETRPAELDTVVIEPDARRVVLVWKAVLACGKKLKRVRRVEPVVARRD